MKKIILNFLTFVFFACGVALFIYAFATAPSRLKEYYEGDYWRICEQYPEAHCGQ